MTSALASETKRDVLGISLLASDTPRDYGALVDAILEFYAAIGRPLTWFSGLGRKSWGKVRKFRPKSFRDYILDEDTKMAHFGPEGSATEHSIEVFLRPDNPAKQEYETRWITLTATGLAYETPAVRTLLARLIDLHPIVHGGIGGYRSLVYAAKECSFSGAVSGIDLDEVTRERLGEDQMLRGRFLRRVRRLYPITIVGPTLWKELPSLPALGPMPKVETVGDCKLIHAWPELVEPRDPEFLAGTTELRRWLWPFTIQNPADALEGEP
jgi:hypothetical protein